MSRIDPHLLEQVEILLSQGIKKSVIARMLHVSRPTIDKIEKKQRERTPPPREDIPDDFDASVKLLTKLSEKERSYIKKIEKQRLLYEDDTEGWTYHVTEQQLRMNYKGLWWAFIVYPESAPEDWEERISALHCEWSHSPLHDKDKWEHNSPEIVDAETGEVLHQKGELYQIGDRKKAHWHCIIKFDKSMSFSEVNDLIRPITIGPYAQKCNSLKGAYEYFIHLNHPDRYQYEKDEICSFNGFVIEPTNREKAIMLNEIANWIHETECDEWYICMDHYRDQYEYIGIIANKGYVLQKLVQSYHYKHKPYEEED